MYISDLQTCSYTAGPTRNTRHNTLASTRLYPLCCTCTMMDARTGVLPRRRVSVLQGITVSQSIPTSTQYCAWVRARGEACRSARPGSTALSTRATHGLPAGQLAATCTPSWARSPCCGEARPRSAREGSWSARACCHQTGATNERGGCSSGAEIQQKIGW